VEDIYLDTTRDFEEAERLLGVFFKKYDPDLYVVDDATVLLERFSKMNRLVSAAMAGTARRLETPMPPAASRTPRPGSLLLQENR
jgi:hypothetical protein